MADNPDFIGRCEQIALLRRVQGGRKNSVLTAIYGRRRIGKTTLVEHAFAEDEILTLVRGLR